MADTASVISEPSNTPHPDKILKFKFVKVIVEKSEVIDTINMK